MSIIDQEIEKQMQPYAAGTLPDRWGIACMLCGWSVGPTEGHRDHHVRHFGVHAVSAADHGSCFYCRQPFPCFDQGHRELVEAYRRELG
jgi:hypothetical protein